MNRHESMNRRQFLRTTGAMIGAAFVLEACGGQSETKLPIPTEEPATLPQEDSASTPVTDSEVTAAVNQACGEGPVVEKKFKGDDYHVRTGPSTENARIVKDGVPVYTSNTVEVKQSPVGIEKNGWLCVDAGDILNNPETLQDEQGGTVSEGTAVYINEGAFK